MMTMTELRAAFWAEHPEWVGEKRRPGLQNMYICDIRCAWADFVDAMQRDGQISEKTAEKAVL